MGDRLLNGTSLVVAAIVAIIVEAFGGTQCPYCKYDSSDPAAKNLRWPLVFDHDRKLFEVDCGRCKALEAQDAR